VLRQEQLLRLEREKLKQEKDRVSGFWTSFIQTVDQLYGVLPTDQERIELLTRHLKDPAPELRLWAIGKLYQWRTSGRPIPGEFGTIMASVVADEDRRVRLEAARLLSITGQLGPVDQLLARLDAEQDEQVKTMLLLALGQACDFRLGTPGSPQVSTEVRQKTLEWAGQFLGSNDPNKIRTGAQVMQRLLDKPSILPAEDVDRYLKMLEQTVGQLTSSQGQLKADLLRVMGLLCDPQSGSRELACKRFGPVFDAAYRDQDDRVRELAVEGMILVDPGLALQRLRQGAINERNPNIRAKVIELAGQVGTPEDLEWLTARLIPKGPDLDPAWQAICSILVRADLSVAGQWLTRFKSQDMPTRLQAQWVGLLQLIERKAAGSPSLLRQVLGELVAYYKAAGDAQAEAGALARLVELSEGQQRAQLAGRLLGIYIGLGMTDEAARLLSKALEQQDLTDQDPLVQALWQSRQADKGSREVLEAVLKSVTTGQGRPNWERIKGHLLGSEE
jgi:hypothetical protein